MATVARKGKGTRKPKASGAGMVLLTLCVGQFLMMLDTSVMNVSMATVAKDVGTTVAGIQTAITLYTLVMASLMITGGKIGQIIGRKRAFTIGSIIYGCGSLTTALSPSLPVLLFGWSLLEGLGAALILPAIVALVATNFPRDERPRAYGLVASAGGLIDYISFNLQAGDYSIGRVSTGSSNCVLNVPTPNGSNTAAAPDSSPSF